jgi:signal transduction histidine kinase
MTRHSESPNTLRPAAGPRLADYQTVSQQILRLANRELSHSDFLRELVCLLLDFSGCDLLDLHVVRDHQRFFCEAVRGGAGPAGVTVTNRAVRDGEKKADPATWRGSGDGQPYPAEIVVPLIVVEREIGRLMLRSRKKDFFPPSAVGRYQDLAQTVGLVLVNQYAQASLRERIKELTCLYGIAQLAEQPSVPLPALLQGIVELLPPAWQYPEIAVARVLFDDGCYATAGIRECDDRQMARLVTKGQSRGSVEVGYVRTMPRLDEGPFLKEERSLIDAVALQISLLIERREAADEQSRLRVQLRHADRLATIGQLSAGVAHELNEPLGNILAFAQLARKQPGIPQQTAADLDKIVATSLHAREIIKKLMLFARQMPPQKSRMNLNEVVAEALSFLESRCEKNGVTLERRLAPQLPELVADRSQLNQVLVNLAVNAIQAMPHGGVLKVSTQASDHQVVLIVEDTGIGMSAKVLKKIFMPFFTTKDIHEGTGLGLPVVHGIIVSHGGTIDVQSVPGRGSRFEVRLPAIGDSAPSSPLASPPLGS